MPLLITGLFLAQLVRVVTCQVSLGSAGAFGALSAANISSTGAVISGNLGAYGTISGSISCTGVEYMGASVLQAVNNAHTAFQEIAALSGTTLLEPNLDGYFLGPGVYGITTQATLEAVLTLNGTQPPGQNQWYFQLNSSLTTFEGSEVVQVGLGTPCDVFWLVMSTASFGITSAFIGNVLAESIDAGFESSFFGGLYASQDITLQSSVTVFENCPAPSTSSSSSSPSSIITTASSSSSPLPTSSSSGPSLPTSSSLSSSLPTSSSLSSSLPTSSSLSPSLPTSSSLSLSLPTSSSSSLSSFTSSSSSSPLPTQSYQVSLGSAGAFGALSAGNVTNSGLTIISGNIGAAGSVSGNPDTEGFDFTGSQVISAIDDAQAAYQDIEAMTGAIALPAELNGLRLPPGLYKVASAASLSSEGILILNSTEVAPTASLSSEDIVILNSTESLDNNKWYFQIMDTLTTYGESSVQIIGLGKPCNVFWMVASAASFGNNSGFVGNVLAQSISADTGAYFEGGLYAVEQDIELDTNTVAINCPTQVTSTSSSSSSSAATSSSSSVSSTATTTSSPGFSLPTPSPPGSSLPTPSLPGSSLPTPSSPGSSLPMPGSPSSSSIIATGSTSSPISGNSADAKKGWSVSGTIILVFLLNAFVY